MLEEGADIVIAVIRQSLAIRYQDQENIEQEFMMAESFPKAIAQEPMLNKGETVVDSADSLRIKRFFCNHDTASLNKL